MKKIILFLVVALGLLPMLTKQGLTVSAFKMNAQDALNLVEPVCIPTPTIRDSYSFGDWTYDTVCTLVLNATWDDCEDDCHTNVSYTPETTGEGDNGNEPYNPYPDDEPDDPHPNGAGGGSNGGSSGTNTGSTTTTNPDFPLKSMSIPLGTTSIKLNEKREVVNGVTVITMAPIVKQIPQIPFADLGKIISSYNTVNGQSITTLGVQTQINAFNQSGTPLSMEVLDFLINLQ